MRHVVRLQVGPIAYRIGSDWERPLAQLAALYEGYPESEEPVDFTVRLEAASPARRWIRPSIRIGGDYELPGEAPLGLALGLLAAELGMNLQMALGQKTFLLLHAATVERDGRAILMTGESGAGKSTLAALLGEAGWRLMGDEFALVDLADGSVRAFPRAISLKNEAIDLMGGHVAAERFGPILRDTPKGTIRHLRPNRQAIANMDRPARPVLILFPRFGTGLTEAVRPVGSSEVFVRLTQASTNYVTLGERGFDALMRLVTDVPARALDYPDAETAFRLVERLWVADGA